MGYIRHNAIVVTGSLGKTFEDEGQDIGSAYLRAVEVFGEAVSDVVPSPSNEYHTFFIAPDGSKEGWEEDRAGDVRREAYVTWLKRRVYGDGSSSLKWAEVIYGDDEGKAAIVAHN